MLDIVFSRFRELADKWDGEVKQRRAITQIDPVADDAAYRARELRDALKTLERETEMLSPIAFAMLHKTTPQTVTAWCRAGKVRCQPNGRSYLIPRDVPPPRSRAAKQRVRL